MKKADGTPVNAEADKQQETEQKQKRLLERKIFRSTVILYTEKLWIALWPPLAVTILFLIIALTDIWSITPSWVHSFSLVIFGILFILSFVPLFFIKWPRRKDAVSRIEKISGLKHNPITSFEDQLGANTSSRNTQNLWTEHKKQLLKTFSKLKTGRPVPRVDKHDPFAIRVILVLTLFIGILFTGALGRERILSAFTVKVSAVENLARLDAWITPPAYTEKAPVILSDGSRKLTGIEQEKRIIRVPENSELQIRIANPDSGRYKILTSSDLEYGVADRNSYSESKTNTVESSSGKNPVTQFKTRLKKTISITIRDGSFDLYQWHIYIEDDMPPDIKLIEPVRTTIRNALRLEYTLSDDYGITSASAIFNAPGIAPGNAENNPDTPLGKAPEISLVLPAGKTRSGNANTYYDLTSHPWAGLKTVLTLRARDEAGQTSSSRPKTIILPRKHFRQPLAKALIEQRRLLVHKPHSNYYPVMRALHALTAAADELQQDPRVYLGIRSVYWRMRIRRTREIAQSAVDQLWDIALYIEDGNLSEAERQMKLAQEKLADSLRNGASGEEIRKQLEELRASLARFLSSVARKNPTGEEILRGTGNQKILTPQDLDRMLRNIEDLAKSGSRDLAAKMLAELREMLENINTNAPRQNSADAETMKALEKLGEIISDQQKLLDQTYSVDKQATAKENAKAEKKHLDKNRGQLAGEQARLRELLKQLSKKLSSRGMPSNEDLSQAGNSMEQSIQSIQNSKLKSATQQQTLTLDKLRKGAQSMTNQLMKRMGQPMQGTPRNDPFGRPSPNNGPDFNGGRNMIDKVQTQRAREILQELRERYSNSKRPPAELDYLERLLQRF